MLGPRVPAVLVSPLIERGTLVNQVFEQASVPATLCHLHAPDHEPLTSRDASASTFATVPTRGTPRQDLPDLSAHTSTLGTDASTDLPPQSTAPPKIPEYYRDFLAQTELVRQHLDGVNEPEMTRLQTGSDLSTRASAITHNFAEAAERHRRAQLNGAADE